MQPEEDPFLCFSPNGGSIIDWEAWQALIPPAPARVNFTEEALFEEEPTTMAQGSDSEEPWLVDVEGFAFEEILNFGTLVQPRSPAPQLLGVDDGPTPTTEGVGAPASSSFSFYFFFFFFFLFFFFNRLKLGVPIPVIGTLYQPYFFFFFFHWSRTRA